MDDMQEILEDFLVEAFELIEQIDHDLVELESNPEDLELLNRIFRVAHTVKGSSSFLNFDVLTKLTHHMEDVLNKARHGELKITPDIMDVVLESVDMMKALLRSIRERGNDVDAGVNISDICDRLTAINEGKDISSSKPKEEVKEEAKEPSAMDQEPEVDVNSLSEAEVEAEIERLLKVRKAEDQARREKQKQNEQSEAPASKVETSAPKESKPQQKESNTPAQSSASAVEQTIRVEVKRLDHLMNSIG